MKKLILTLALFANVADAQLIIAPNEATAARRRVPVYLVQAADGATEITGATIASNNDSDCADATDECCVSKAGGTKTFCTGTLTELSLGEYYYEFAAAEVDTVGYLTVRVDDSAARPFIGFAQVGLAGDVFAPTGTAQAGTATTITLASTASAVDNIYNQILVVTTGGTGGGQTRRVSSYVGSTRVATINRAWAVTPDSTTTYALVAADGDVVTIEGVDATTQMDAHGGGTGGGDIIQE